MTFAKLGGRERCKSAPWQRKNTGCSECYDNHKTGMRTEDFEAGHAAIFRGSAIHRLWLVGKIIYVSEEAVCISENKDKNIAYYQTALLWCSLFPSLVLFYFIFFIANIPSYFTLTLLKWKLHEGRDFCFFCSLKTLPEPRTEPGAYGCSIQFFQGMNLFCSHFRVIVKFRKNNVCKRAL